MKKTSLVIVLVIVIAAVVASVIFVPQFVHKCDDCSSVYFGTGYKPNILKDIFSDDMNRICKDCAEKQHMLSGILGTELDEYKYELFENPDSE